MSAAALVSSFKSFSVGGTRICNLGIAAAAVAAALVYLVSLVQILTPLMVSYMAWWFGILVAQDRQPSIGGLVLGLRLVPACDAATALYTRFFLLPLPGAGQCLRCEGCF